MNADRFAQDPANEVVIYGDFNCPFSALAHRRAMAQQERNLLHVDWRAIEHDRAIPSEGELVDEKTHDDLAQELEQIRDLLVDGEVDSLQVPTRRANTGRLNALYASTAPTQRADFRRSVFDAYWIDDLDVNNAEFVQPLATVDTPTGRAIASEWQREWQALERRIVPMMRLPDGKLSRGLGVLRRLE